MVVTWPDQYGDRFVFIIPAGYVWYLEGSAFEDDSRDVYRLLADYRVVPEGSVATDDSEVRLWWAVVPIQVQLGDRLTFVVAGEAKHGMLVHGRAKPSR
jgi:hypothetical protein